MEKQTRIILIVTLSIIALLLTIVLTLGIVFYRYGETSNILNNFSFSSKELKKSEKISTSNIQNIEIDVQNIDIQIQTTMEDTVQVDAYAKDEIEKEELFIVKKENNQIEIQNNTNKSRSCFFCFGDNSVTYKIYIPKKYSENLKIKTSSGDITIDNDLVLKMTSLNSSSGDIETYNIKSDQIDIQSNSGEIDLKNIEANNIIIQSTSGDISVEDITGKTNLESSSGEIEVHSLKGTLDAKSSSGDIEIESFFILGKSTIETSSGEIQTTFDSKSNCKIIANTGSGNVRYPNKEHRIGINPYHLMIFETNSGDIRARVK